MSSDKWGGWKGGWEGSSQSTSQRAMRFMQAMEKKKSVIKLQIREEWFAMGMWSFFAGRFCRIAYVQVCTQLQNLLKLENSRAPAKSAIFAIFAKFAKNWRNGKICWPRTGEKSSDYWFFAIFANFVNPRLGFDFSDYLLHKEVRKNRK